MDWTHRLRLRQLDVLLSLGRTLNLTRTAAEMNAHQSGLSKVLKELEDDLGVRLFDRRGRGIIINDSGRIALAHAARIKAAVDAFRDEMAVLTRRGQGLLSIGVTGASSIDALLTTTLSLLRQSPDVHIRITEGTADLLKAKLVNDEIDLFIGQSGLVFDPAHNVLEEPLYRDQICAVVRPGHPLAGLEGVTWDDVTLYPLAVWANETPIRRALDNALALHNWKLPPTYVECNSASISLNLLVNSDMVSFSMSRGAEVYKTYGTLAILSLDFESAGAISLYSRQGQVERILVTQARARVRQHAS